MSAHRSPEERPVLVCLHSRYECGKIGGRGGTIIALPLPVAAHPVHDPHASRAKVAEAGDAHARVVTSAVPRRPDLPDGDHVAVDIALKAQLVCELGTGLAAAEFADSAIDTLQFKLAETWRFVCSMTDPTP